MNFLAHLYLTYHQPEEVSVGNFMADAVKGKMALAKYPAQIQKGIYIHRAIDHFTDSHSLFQTGTQRLHRNYGKFSPIIMDIFYDHILAENWNDYSSVSLEKFNSDQCEMLARYLQIMPERTQFWYSIMARDNLLLSYASEEGIASVLKRMERRAGGLSKMGSAIEELKTFKPLLSNEFKAFFSEIQLYLENEFFKVELCFDSGT